MLVAAQNNKLNPKFKLWEDEITSIVFGEMRHLPPKDIWSVFNRLIPDDQKVAINWPDVVPDEIEFNFWKRGKVEPDLSINFFHQRKHRQSKPQASLLIEIKWDAKLYPKCELVRQWNDWEYKDIPTVHFYLVKDSASGWNEIKQSIDLLNNRCASFETACCQDNDHKRSEVIATRKSLPGWEKSLRCISWRDMVCHEKDMSCLTLAGRRWASELNAFLQKSGIENFTGFEWLSVHPWIMLSPEPFLQFYGNKSWFSFLETQISFPGASPLRLFEK